MQEFLNSYGAEIATGLGVIVGWILKKFFILLENYVAGTSNKIDDALLEKVKEAVKEALNNGTAANTSAK